MDVLISRPAPSAMQSGGKHATGWCLTLFPVEGAASVNWLTGWTASSDTTQQLVLHFATKEAAIALAEKQGWHYTVRMPSEVRLQPQSYADNFTKSSPPCASASHDPATS